MSAPAREYHVFATWTVGGNTRYVGTITELRGGQWYDGVLADVPELANRFSDSLGVQRANDVQLSLSDGPGGIYRADALGGAMEGVTASVTLVMRSTDPATGVASEITAAQTLTVVGSGTTPGRVKLRLVDLEEEKMRGLYPPTLWQASDWPDISDRDSGRAVCFPVGTALKLPAVQIKLDTSNSQWTFGACEGVAKTAVITSVSSGLKRFLTSTDIRPLVQVGQVVYVYGTAASDGRYTVSAITGTFFNVVETVPASAGGGTVRIMPHPLTVYRNGRIVPATEYAAHHLRKPGTVYNGDFSLGGAGWTPWYYTTGGGFTNPTPPGSALITFGLMGATIFSASGADYAFLQQYGNYAGTFDGMKGMLFAVQVTIVAGATDAVLTAEGPPVMQYRCKAGTTTTVILTHSVYGNTTSFGVGVWGNAGTVIVSSVRFIPLDATLLLFATEQLDFQGNPYAMECDFAGVESRNAADEIKRLLTHVGLTPDATTFAAAAGVATTEVMLVDCDYGRAGQRRVSAILADLLFVARGGLTRTAAGAYALWQDVAGSVVATYDESAGDNIAVDSYDRDGRPKSVGIKYRPSSRDPRELQNTIKRTISGGTMGDENPREVPYLRDHEAADRLLSYQAARAGANALAIATIQREQRALGDVITVSSSLNWTGPLNWKIRSVERKPNANTLELIQYDATVYTYVPSVGGALDSSSRYQPDYSNTPPAAPSAMVITGGTVSLTRDGTAGVNITVQATPPAVNWSEIWFAVIHNVTGEIIRQAGAFGGVVATANIGGLRGGEVYQLKCFAQNSFGVQGVFLSLFDATAVGGGSPVSTFTTPGLTTPPPDVPFINTAQGTGQLLNIDWGAVSMTADNLAEYVLERNAGGGYAPLWSGRALSYVDRAITYGTGYLYRVKARDRWGNLSTNWRTSSTMTPVRNVSGGSGGDIMDTTVQTVNRTGVTTFSANVPLSGVFRGYTTIAHGMVKTPIAAVVGADADVIGSIHAIDATNITVRATWFGSGDTSSNAPANPHTHNFRAPSPGTTFTVSFTFW